MRKTKSKKLAKATSPFGSWRQPTAKQCQQACEALTALHGAPHRTPKIAATAKTGSRGRAQAPNVLEALVATILSQNTTQKNSSRAMQSLLDTFDNDWGRVHRAGAEKLAQSIRSGGLANVKAKRIIDMLDDIKAKTGSLSLNYLRKLDDQSIKDALHSFKGVGVKTASCVLLFCLGRQSFAVDTHVWRIAKRLGWVPPQATRDQAHLHLDTRVPNDIKYDLHVLLVRHGKTCPMCAANHRPQFPPLGPCPLRVVGAAKNMALGRQNSHAACSLTP